MKSTGEVMGIGSSFGEAYAKAQRAANKIFPDSGLAFISVKESDKKYLPNLLPLLLEQKISPSHLQKYPQQHSLFQCYYSVLLLHLSH